MLIVYDITILRPIWNGVRLLASLSCKSDDPKSPIGSMPRALKWPEALSLAWLYRELTILQ